MLESPAAIWQMGGGGSALPVSLKGVLNGEKVDSLASRLHGWVESQLARCCFRFALVGFCLPARSVCGGGAVSSHLSCCSCGKSAWSQTSQDEFTRWSQWALDPCKERVKSGDFRGPVEKCPCFPLQHIFHTGRRVKPSKGGSDAPSLVGALLLSELKLLISH